MRNNKKVFFFIQGFFFSPVNIIITQKQREDLIKIIGTGQSYDGFRFMFLTISDCERFPAISPDIPERTVWLLET